MSSQHWNIDTSHSSIGFSVRHMMFAKVRGRFGVWAGSLKIDPDDLLRSSVQVEIDAASIDTGVVDRDNHLRSAEFFDAERFPKLRFKSTRIEHVKGEQYKVHGQLTLRDVTKDVVLDVERGGEAKDPWGNQRAAFAAKTSINRVDFGLTWNQVLEAGGVLVGERIDIDLEIQAVQAAEPA